MVGEAPGKKATEFHSLYSKCVNFFVSKYFSIVICLCLVSKDLKWLFLTILSCVTVVPLGAFWWLLYFIIVRGFALTYTFWQRKGEAEDKGPSRRKLPRTDSLQLVNPYPYHQGIGSRSCSNSVPLNRVIFNQMTQRWNVFNDTHNYCDKRIKYKWWRIHSKIYDYSQKNTYLLTPFLA